MTDETKATLDRIHECARREFLEKGFRDASLRKIVKDAGVTTGSFYWYYKSKEELFEALLEDHYRYVLDCYDRALDRFFRYSAEEQKKHMGDTGKECMIDILKYMYAHPEEFRILIEGSSGTRYENLLHEMTEREISSTHRFNEMMKSSGNGGGNISPEMEHIIVSGMFQGLFELITHDVDYETALKCATELHAFHTAGWAHVMKMPVPESIR